MSGWAACGAIMDLGRKCYYSRQRLYKDRPDVSTAGSWRFCPPGARPIPYFHLFGSSMLDDYRDSLDPAVGEIPQWNGFSHGKSNPRLIGQNWCGAVSLWTTGSLYSQRGTPPLDLGGIPTCCVTLFGPIGGGQVGGQALWGSLVSHGGAVGDGHTTFFHQHFLVSAGGQLGDGATVFDHQHFLVSAGGQLGDGVTQFLAAFHPPSTGGAVGDGATVFVEEHFLVSAGGQLGDGATTFKHLFRFELHSTGGGEIDGVTLFRKWHPYYLVSTGGAEGNGSL